MGVGHFVLKITFILCRVKAHDAKEKAATQGLCGNRLIDAGKIREMLCTIFQQAPMRLHCYCLKGMDF